MAKAGDDQNHHYPKPGPIGGRLIRRMVSFLRANRIELPLTSHILIATSGGSDSLALAVLLARYGRRVVARKDITLLHVNHRWRGEESDEDARFVRAQARSLDVGCRIVRLAAPDPTVLKGESWEEQAREARKRIFVRECARLGGAQVLTGHQGDDLAETLLWRIFTGAAETHGAGIAVRHGLELRPLLSFRKSELQAFLREEGRGWREDATNQNGRFLRSRLRLELFPRIELLFPRAVEHLMKLGLAVQQSDAAGCADSEVSAPLLAARALGIRVKRAHFEQLLRAAQLDKRQHEIHLPQGWRLTRTMPRSPGKG
jgi:tRNA(Ile)-lysidine synthase